MILEYDIRLLYSGLLHCLLPLSFSTLPPSGPPCSPHHLDLEIPPIPPSLFTLLLILPPCSHSSYSSLPVHIPPIPPSLFTLLLFLPPSLPPHSRPCLRPFKEGNQNHHSVPYELSRTSDLYQENPVSPNTTYVRCQIQLLLCNTSSIYLF